MQMHTRARRRRRLTRARAVLLCALLALAVSAAGPGSAGAHEEGDLPTVVAVSVPNDAAHAEIVESGLDAGYHETNLVEVWIHDEADLALLDELGYAWTEVSDGSGVAAQARIAEAADAAAQEVSLLPTGRVDYRTLPEINAELAELAAAYPDRVKLFELPHQSLIGQTIYGVEISHDIKTNRGKPVFLNTGVHHAREWPTAEFVLEFAWDVLARDGTDPQITDLLERGKMIVVPVVNPDGYYVSRNRLNGQEQKRKNCRIVPNEIPTVAQCEASTSVNRGVDPNRNYGAFWGGFGTSTSQTATNYRGVGPFSEPEIQNMRELTGAHQITVAINNHTPDGRLLRAPSSLNEPRPVADEVSYQALTDKLGADLSWPAGPWTDIYYQASGTAEQHAYYSAGTYGFTTEATPGHSGLNTFHPPYQNVIEQYFGIGRYANSSIRAAFLTAFEASVDPSMHSIIEGEGPHGVELTLTKEFTMFTVPIGGTPIEVPIKLQTTMTVPRNGYFRWHVNPSLRPSQYAGATLFESWTISCKLGPNKIALEEEVFVARGEVARVDLKRCPEGIKVPLDERWGSPKDE